MLTPAAFRKLALSFAEAEERSHFEQPDFRVRGKIFAGLSRDNRTGTLKLPPELQSMLLLSAPEVFHPAAGAWGRSGWTHVTLATAELGMLRELMSESYARVAPKRLLAAEAASSAQGATKKQPVRREPNPTQRAAQSSKRWKGKK